MSAGMLRIKVLASATALVLGWALSTWAAPSDPLQEREIARLTRDVDRAQAIRAVKTLQISYAQYSQQGLWDEMASLFTRNAELIYGSDDVHGRQAIGRYFLENFGGGRTGLAPGVLHAQFAFSPVVNLSADGQSALGRWHEFSMLGGAKDARWSGGIMENEYLIEHGHWKIAKLHYYPVFAGPYDKGWTNVGPDLPIIPYHYTPEQAGAPSANTQDAGLSSGLKVDGPIALASAARRVIAMNDEDAVRNLQNAYGYYIDRKMWADATDLFTPDAVLEVSNVGVYQGTVSIRRAFARHGEGLEKGELNDRVMPDTIIAISPDGREAQARGLELSMLGDANKGTATLALGVFVNRYVKQGVVWRIREMRLYPQMATDYYLGWGKSAIVDPPAEGQFAPDHPVPTADVPQASAVPAFFAPNPATGMPVVYPSGTPLQGEGRLLKALTTPARTDGPSTKPTLAAAQRGLNRSSAFDAVENLSSAFGNYIDDFSWDQSSALFASDGWRGKYLVGFYIGPDHIRKCESYELGETPSPRHAMDIHLLTQPVILVEDDGTSATVRTRLFHLSTSDAKSGTFASGMYPNNAAKLVGGVWRFEVVAIDEPYFSSRSYADGWSRNLPPPPPSSSTPPPLMQKLIGKLPPDVPLAQLKARYHTFFPGDIANWPEIKPMWFSYKNPVTGRTPSYYCPDLKTCEAQLDSTASSGAATNAAH